jgi:putative transposase
MANTYINLIIHIVFSTKNREPFLMPSIRKRLYSYLNAIANEHDLVTLCVGGTSDHIHLLLSLPSTINLSDALRFLKGGSSHWLRETFEELKSFSWQEGYGAFSIGKSQMDRTKEYIRNQEEHHKKVSFQDEYLAFLKRNNIQYDENFVWG